MRLVSPQPMETLPEKGYVFVEMMEFGHGANNQFVIDRHVTSIRLDFNEPERYKHLAWSYTATTNPNEEEPT